MLETKTFEIRDSATFIPVVAVLLRSQGCIKDAYLLGRAGLGGVNSYSVFILDLNKDQGTMDFNKWNGAPFIRTFPVAHKYIETNWYQLKSGDVIDVEFIQGETLTKKISERGEHYD